MLFKCANAVFIVDLVLFHIGYIVSKGHEKDPNNFVFICWRIFSACVCVPQRFTYPY